MEINDKVIAELTPQTILLKDLYYSILEIEEPEEKTRIEALLKVKAKELGMQKDISDTIKAYNAANDKLAAEYKKSNRHYTFELDYDATGKPIASIDNFIQVLEHDKKFKGLKFNLLSYSPEQERNGKTYRWTDADDAECRHYIEKYYRFHSQQKCDDALKIVFAKNEYHPIRDLIDTFKWDGKPRISMFLNYATHCENTAYTQEVSRLIFAGGIHRLYHPGCKFDDMPVLIGTRQGEGKSTLVRWLALKDDYFTEVNEFDGQRGIESLEGAWICEVSELLALTKSKEQEAVKSFLTRLNDRYRMPFDKRVTEHPRQCLFIGTTNKEQFLTDKTGGRRFYPVTVHQTGYELFDRKDDIQEYIRQCWAEAKAKIDTEEMKPYADRSLTEIIRQMQEAATEDDYRVGMIEDYLEGKHEVCILELWTNALNMPEYSKPTKKDSNDIGMILQKLDEWEKQPKTKRFPGFGVQKYWKRRISEAAVEEIDEDLPF